MDQAVAILSSPPALPGLLAALICAPATGVPTWSVLARGRWGSIIGVSLAVCIFRFRRRPGPDRLHGRMKE